METKEAVAIIDKIIESLRSNPGQFNINVNVTTTGAIGIGLWWRRHCRYFSWGWYGIFSNCLRTDCRSSSQSATTRTSPIVYGDVHDDRGTGRTEIAITVRASRQVANPNLFTCSWWQMVARGSYSGRGRVDQIDNRSHMNRLTEPLHGADRRERAPASRSCWCYANAWVT
jgi:hypothetical protein